MICEYSFAYAYANGHVQRHLFSNGCVYGYACGSVDQGDVTSHLISLLARAEFIHPDDLEVALDCYVSW